MKNLLKPLLLGPLLLMGLFMTGSPSTLNAQTEKKLTHSLKRVKVYLNRAELTHTARTELAPGVYDLVMPLLPISAMQGTEQVSGTGNGIILSVSLRDTYLGERPTTPREKMLRDSIGWYERRIREVEVDRDVRYKELEVMNKNHSVASQNQGVTAAALLQLLDLIRDRSLLVNRQLLALNTQLTGLNERLGHLRNELGQAAATDVKPSKELIVTYEARSAGPATFTFSYLTAGSGWKPSYDLRAENATGNISLGLKADVLNQTGLEWKGVDLLLTSAQPNMSLALPDPGNWRITFLPQIQTISGAYRKSLSQMAPAAAPRSREEGTQAGYDAAGEVADEQIATMETAAGYTIQREGALAQEYEVQLKYDIPTDGRYHTVQLQELKLPATFNHFAAPRVDNKVYLQAEITGWEQYSLVPGEANLYFQNTFIGKTYLDPASTNDTLRLALGQDPRVILKRERLRDRTKRQVLGDKVKETHLYQIAVRNNKNEAIELVVEDVFPVSNNADITVELKETTNAQVNTERGRLTWKLKLKPGESQNLRFGFEVTYPKNRPIMGL
jgi:uncharacterized protein (TIGR02231 family)